MIYDCFSFNNENDILDIRLNTLNDVVDKFVIIEASKTHQGAPKTQFDKERFEKFMDKIIYVFLEDIPDFKGETWHYENYQRNYILNVLRAENCSPDDVIIISDVDEIPSAWQVRNFFSYLGIEGATLSLKSYIYRLNLQVINSNWHKAKMVRYSYFLNPNNYSKDFTVNYVEELNQEITPTGVRFAIIYPILEENTGWHFSSMGSAEDVVNKLKSFAHKELNYTDIANVDNIQYYIDNRLSIWGKPLRCEISDLDSSLPKYLCENPKTFKHLLLDKNNN